MTPEVDKVWVANTWLPLKFPCLGIDSNDNPRSMELCLASFVAKTVETKAISTSG